MAYINSSMVSLVLKQLSKELPHYYSSFIKSTGAQNIEDIINMHALGAAAAGLAAGWLPGAGGVAALAANIGFVWSMYYRINNELGIPLSKNTLKSLGSAVLTNLAGNAMALVGGVALATVLSFTGVGNIASSLLMAALDYAVVLVSGVIYLKILTKLFKAGTDPRNASEEDLKSMASSVMAGENLSGMLKQAKKDYTNAKKSGQVTGKERIDIVEG